MYTYKVLVRGPNGYLECGLYSAGYITDALEVSVRLANKINEDGYIQLSNADGGFTTIFKETILSFSITPVKDGCK